MGKLTAVEYCLMNILSFDSIAVFATIFGVATLLGLGAVQINGGLFYTSYHTKNYCC